LVRGRCSARGLLGISHALDGTYEDRESRKERGKSCNAVSRVDQKSTNAKPRKANYHATNRSDNSLKRLSPAIAVLNLMAVTLLPLDHPQEAVRPILDEAVALENFGWR
jgi:hypothetical protein